MSYFLNRLREPSTWAGLSSIAVLFGVPANTVQLVTQAIVAVTAAAAVLVPEKKPQ